MMHKISNNLRIFDGHKEPEGSPGSNNTNILDNALASFGRLCRKCRISSDLVLAVVTGLKLLALTQDSQGASATLAWDRAASHTNLSAFVLKYGVASGVYTQQVSVATNLTTATVNDLVSGVTYYFVVTAKNVANLESDPSNQISYTVPTLDISPRPIATLTATSLAAGTVTINMTGTTDSGFPSAVGQLWFTSRRGQYSQYQQFAGGTTTLTINGLRNGTTYWVVGRLRDPVTGRFGPATPERSVTIISSAGSLLPEEAGVIISAGQAINETFTASNGAVPPAVVPPTPVAQLTMGIKQDLVTNTVSGNAHRQVTLMLEGSPGQLVTVQATDDETTASGWHPIASVQLPNTGKMIFVPASANRPKEFYRLVPQ